MGTNRSSINHPALNTAGGSGLWTQIDNIYQLLSDQDLGRWVSFSALANGASQTITHGFGVPFDDLKVVVYTGTYPNLSQVQTFTVAATSGFEKTKIDITAPASGGPFTGHVLIVHDVAMKQRVLTTTERNNLQNPYVGMFVYDSTLGKPAVYTSAGWKIGSDTNSVETLSNKTLVEPVIDNFMELNEEAAPATPAVGKVRMYAKTDGKIYKKDDTGAESEVGSGGAGTGRNYLQDWFDATKPVSISGNPLTSGASRATSATLWAASDAGQLTIQNNTTNALRQAGDFLFNSGGTAILFTVVESPLFSLDQADLGKPLSVEFDITGVAASSSYDVVVVRYNAAGAYQELISIAGTASTGTPASAQLPTGTTKFRGFFIPSSTSDDQYALRFRKLAAVDDDFQVDSLFVGPQSLAQGAVVTAWQSYTPAWTTNGTAPSIGNGSIVGSWRRVGETMEVRIGLSWGSSTNGGSGEYRFSMPSGYTANPQLNIGNPLVGYAKFLDSGTSVTIHEVEYAASNQVRIYANSTANVWSSSSPATWTNGDRGDIYFSIPILEWSSGTTTLADRALEEYAWSTDPTTTAGNTQADNGLYGNGPSGVQFYSFATGTVNSRTTKRVRFQTAVQPTDTIILEWTENGGAIWHPVANSYINFSWANSSSYGMSLAPVSGSTTDYYVQFGNMGYLQSAATYAGGGNPWSILAGSSNYKWRVRKVSSGAQVGYPVSARNIVGDTSGTAVPSGMIGEVITWSTVPTTQTFTTEADWTNAVITVPAGVWRLQAEIQVYSNKGSTVAGDCNTYVKITNSSNTVIENCSARHGVYINSATELIGTALISLSAIVSVSSNTQYKIRAYKAGVSGSASELQNSGDSKSRFYAVRIG